MTVSFSVQTESREQAVPITDSVQSHLNECEINSGVHVWVPHTTAGIAVNESADPNVMDDVIPWDNDYTHIEENAASHIKSMLTDCHQWIPVQDNKLELGRWQGLFLLEWDGPRTRNIQLYGDA
ncbi:MAG: secondary thiamine-phosphate synthase enzyme YjbQ [bacterium]